MERKPSPITLDQVVAYNLRRARQMRGWTQAQAAEKLEPFLGERWSPAVFSAAERSYESDRVREFSASDVLAFSMGFSLPIAWFYEPPAHDTHVTSRGASYAVTGEELVKLLGRSDNASAPEFHPLHEDQIKALISGRVMEELKLEAARASVKTLADVLINLANLQAERGADGDEGFAAGVQALLAIYGVSVTKQPGQPPEKDIDDLAFYARLAADAAPTRWITEDLKSIDRLVEMITGMPQRLSEKVVENWARGHRRDSGVQDAFAKLPTHFAPDLIAATAADHPDLVRALYGASDAWKIIQGDKEQRQTGSDVHETRAAGSDVHETTGRRRRRKS